MYMNSDGTPCCAMPERYSRSFLNWRPVGFVGVCLPRSADAELPSTATSVNLSSNVMSAPVPHLTGLPAEILEHVLLRLPGQDIVKVEAVRRSFANPRKLLLTCCCTIQVGRHFRALIRNSPILQYHCELFAAGLIDNPSNPCDLAERRKLCEEYARKWSDAATVVGNIYELSSDKSSHWGCYTALGRNILVSSSTSGVGLDFLCIPPVASGNPINGWTIPPFPFDVLGVGVYHPENVLGVVERQEL